MSSGGQDHGVGATGQDAGPITDEQVLREMMGQALEAEAELFAKWEAEQDRKRQRGGASGRGQSGGPDGGDVGQGLEPLRRVDFKEVWRAFHDNEAGDARLAVQLLEGRYCQDNASGEAYRMGATIWAPDTNMDHMRAVREVAALYRHVASWYHGQGKDEPTDPAVRKKGFSPNLDKRDQLLKRATALLTDRKTASVWRMATAGDGSLGVSGERWNAEPTLLPCLNCVVDLETGKAYDAKPARELWFNRRAAAEWCGLNVEAALWDEIVSQALRHDQDLIDYFGLFAGFAATGFQTKDFFAAFGPGGNNGKSVVFEWIMRVLGGFAGQIPVELLLQDRFMRNAQGPSPALMELRGLRLAVTSEAQRNQRFSLNQVKLLTSGGDKIKARDLYARRGVEFEQSATLAIHTNFLPQAEGNDQAWWDRLRVLPFRARFVDPDREEVDESLHIYRARPRVRLDRELDALRPGILAWLVRNAMRAVKLGDMPRPPAAVLEETAEYREEQDMVGQFLRTCTVSVPDRAEQMKDIHGAFRKWCVQEMGLSEKGKGIWSVKALAADLKQRPEFTREVGRVVCYRGLQILDEWRADDEDGHCHQSGYGKGLASTGTDDQVPF